MDKLFDTKRTYTGYDGEEYVDMCIPVIKINKINAARVAKLSRDSQGRIDTFTWNTVENDLDMIDMVMYANHLFNPFSIEEGDVLIIPSVGSDIYKSSDEPSLPDGTKNSNNINGKKARTYAETIEYIARRGLGVK